MDVIIGNAAPLEMRKALLGHTNGDTTHYPAAEFRVKCRKRTPTPTAKAS